MQFKFGTRYETIIHREIKYNNNNDLLLAICYKIT
jgi:hypothetical protein